MQEGNRTKQVLDVVVPRSDSHQLHKEDHIVDTGRKDTKFEENTEEEPLPNVAEHIS